MKVDVEKLSDEQLSKLQDAINTKLTAIVINAEKEANKLLEPYGLDFKMIVSIGSTKEQET